MEFATGAMGTLLPKLGALLQEEYKLQKSVKKGVKDLEDELLTMQAALKKISNVPLDQLDPVVRIWASDIRDLSYAIEDSLDSFMVSVEGLEPTKIHDFMGFINKASNKITKFKVQHKMANDIKDIKVQVKEIKERYDRYRVDDVVAANISAPTVDPRILSLYSNMSDLVGIDIGIDELTKKVLGGTAAVSGRKLNTVSVVGFGGLGKTTLTKVVYDKLARKFDCAGFVPVGQNPDMKNVLSELLRALDKKKYMDISASKLNVNELIDEVREFLSDKRYLTVIDDLWDTQTWEIIKCAFVDINGGSRIIITTRISEVAKRVGGVYSVKILSEENSRKLFNRRIFGSTEVNPDNQSAEVPNKILKKCGGVPLSIVTIASLLVNKPIEDWCQVYDSIGFGQEENDVVQNTRKILAFSYYYDLPSHLKTCLLYLSIFPEEWLNRKFEVMWRLVAEGIVSNKQGKGFTELADSYLTELINRNMIQLIDDDIKVHDMVLDLIRALSIQTNFVTIQDNGDQQTTCSSSRKNNVRRLAMHKTSIDHSHSIEMEHIRSFNAFLCSGERMPPLQSFKVLRVLELADCNFSGGSFDLKYIGKLVQLRYLNLQNTKVEELPSEIGLLKLLQVLIISKIGIEELPPSVSELSNLVCLVAFEGMRMMGDVRKLTSLEYVKLYSVDKSPNFITNLGKLAEVRVLDIYFDDMDQSMQEALVGSLRNLRKITIVSITLQSEETESLCLHIWEEWAPPSTLCSLELYAIILPKQPSWINPSCVPHMRTISLELEVLEARDMQILGRLPLLRFLFLVTSKEYSISSYTAASDEFSNLGLLDTNIEIICGEGALPMLYYLHCDASVGKDVGLVGNMPLLKEVTYWLDCKDCSAEEVEEAEEALMQAAKNHPNQPTLTITRLNEEEASVTEEDVRTVTTYLKDVLHVSEGVSDTDEDVSTVAYLRRVLHLSERSPDEDIVKAAATELRGVLRAPEAATIQVLRGITTYYMRQGCGPWKVSATDQQDS